MLDNPRHIQIKKADDSSLQIYKRNYINKDGSLPGTLWDEKKYAAGSHGTNLLTNMFGKGNSFSFPKSVFAVEDCLLVSNAGGKSIILDYFAGSGTTGHAVIKLEKEDPKGRKYILVEMGEYFDDVLKPRMQKVIYSENWKKGKPLDEKGISQIIKYLKLESYEDTLNNLVLNRTENQQSLLSSNSSLKQDYFLHYMLDVETRNSSSLLKIDELEDPFNYSLEITSNNEQKRQVIDISETFNYLVGLHVSQRYLKTNCLIYTGVQHQTNRKVDWKYYRMKAYSFAYLITASIRCNPIIKVMMFKRFLCENSANLKL